MGGAVAEQGAAPDDGPVMPAEPRWSMRQTRDVLTLAAGLGLFISQVILQFQGQEPNLALIAAGVSLLGVVPLVNIGDRKADEGKRS